MKRPLLALCLLGLALPLLPAGAQTSPEPATPRVRRYIDFPARETQRTGRFVPNRPRGTYADKLHVVPAPEDRETYGSFYDWGFWSGTSYKGHSNLTPGYWVYSYPNWHVWKTRVGDAPTEPPTFIRRDKRNWGPEQATGEPDTLASGDIATAWASKTQDDQDEWLELTYAEAVIPSAVLVHETYNPGALVRVTARRPDGGEVTVWTGRDPLEPNSGRGVAIIPFRTDFKTNRIRLHLDSKGVSGWNEIDAVGLIDEFGRTQWAAGAEASSTYASDDPAVPGLADPGAVRGLLIR